MLDKELDKLRDKTLSFGCKFSISWKEWWVERTWTLIKNTGNWIRKTIDANLDIRDAWFIEWREREQIIWHPLTLWRIYHIYWNVNQWNRDLAFYEVRHAIEQWLVDNNRLDKSELERMQHEKRPELKKHLIQFSNYL